MFRTAASLLILLSTSAQAVDNAPLPPGRPAGVHQARFQMNYPVVFVGAALAAIVGGLYLSKQNAATTSTTP